MSGAVVVWNREQACRLKGADGSVLISISCPGDPAPLMPGWAPERVLRLEFDDVSHEHEGMVVSGSMGERAIRRFRSGHAKAILEFATKHRERTIHVHCDAGVSRSVAVGVALSEWLEKSLVLKATHSTGLANGWVLSSMRRLTIHKGYT
jgi:predicted protein tyrosine phosphatase